MWCFHHQAETQVLSSKHCWCKCASTQKGDCQPMDPKLADEGYKACLKRLAQGCGGMQLRAALQGGCGLLRHAAPQLVTAGLGSHGKGRTCRPHEGCSMKWTSLSLVCETGSYWLVSMQLPQRSGCSISLNCCRTCKMLGAAQLQASAAEPVAEGLDPSLPLNYEGATLPIKQGIQPDFGTAGALPSCQSAQACAGRHQ